MTYVALFAGDLGLDHCLALTAMANRLFVNAGSSSLSSPIGCEKPVRMPSSCLYVWASHGHGIVAWKTQSAQMYPAYGMTASKTVASLDQATRFRLSLTGGRDSARRLIWL